MIPQKPREGDMVEINPLPLHNPVVRLPEMKLNTTAIPDIFACLFINHAAQKLGIMLLYV